MPGPLPQILEQPNIPKPLHGLNPRTIMGQEKWDVMRRQVYRKYGHSCAACGVHANNAKIKGGIEAHENFKIDYSARRMTLIGMEPVCHACHSFVHSGLLELRLARRKITAEDVAVILGHGVGVLDETGGRMPWVAAELCRKLGLDHGLRVSTHPRTIRWSGWTMVWDGMTYPSPYPTPSDWQRAMRKNAL